MSPADVRRSRVPRPVRALVLALPRGVTRLRRHPPPERWALVLLVSLSLLLVVAGELAGPSLFPPAAQAVPLLIGGLLLGRRGMRRLMVVAATTLLFDAVRLGLMDARPGGFVVVAITGVVAYEFARSREETGLSGNEGDTVLVELRNRLEAQGRMPALPRSWDAEAVLRPAGGGPFAGDFVVSGLTAGGSRLELALVDVSGKGVAAGTRALLLSGAMGGLLGAVPPDRFLQAANDYVNRQDWPEGFATAVHLALDLRTGDYSVESAGHPPAAVFDAGSGRWGLLPHEGVALGLLPEVDYQSDHGRLEAGDALLLYTDGLVEVAGRDLEVGIDKLLGEAERLVPRGFVGGADVLVGRVAAESSDDRALVLVWRGL